MQATEIVFVRKPIEALTHLDLIEAATSPGELGSIIHAYSLANETAEHGELLFFLESGRAGIAWGADAVWTDASSVEDAIRRYAEDDLIA